MGRCGDCRGAGRRPADAAPASPAADARRATCGACGPASSGARRSRRPRPASSAWCSSLPLAVVLRLSLGGEDAPAPAPAVAPGPSTATAAPVPAEATAPKSRLLKPGAQGPVVSDLQAALTALGLHSGADGDYGPATAAAVASFQASSGLAADGVAGSDTTAALHEALVERAEEDAAAVEAGIASAADAGRLDPATAERARAGVAATVEAIRTQAPGRAAVLGLVLRDVAAVADGYTENRAALFEELDANVEALAAAPPQIMQASVADGAGVVYRYFPDHGYQFHPLASFGTLNGLVRQGEREKARRLAEALVARGVRSGKALLWQYRFPFGGPDVWTSGFAQATAAQSLAATGQLVGDPELVDAAAAAFRAIPRDLTLRVGGGDWIQEYSFSDMAVLNAQLQSIVSLREYVGLSGDEDARAYVAGLLATTTELLPSFDTGCWSLYSLDGNPATDSYHAYHVRLLQRLGHSTGEPALRDAGARWRGYQTAGC